MIDSRPKLSALFAVGLFLLLIIATDIWLIFGLATAPESFFIWKLVLIPVLFTIAIVVAVKSYFSAVRIQLGKERIVYRYLLGNEKSLKLTDVQNWEEQVVKRKGSDYRQLSIRLVNNKKLIVSNQENSHYEQVVKYLRKKVR